MVKTFFRNIKNCFQQENLPAWPWNDDVVVQRFDEQSFRQKFTNNFLVQSGTCALLEKSGQHCGVLPPGNYPVPAHFNPAYVRLVTLFSTEPLSRQIQRCDGLEDSRRNRFSVAVRFTVQLDVANLSSLFNPANGVCSSDDHTCILRSRLLDCVGGCLRDALCTYAKRQFDLVKWREDGVASEQQLVDALHQNQSLGGQLGALGIEQIAINSLSVEDPEAASEIARETEELKEKIERGEVKSADALTEAVARKRLDEAPSSALPSEARLRQAKRKFDERRTMILAATRMAAGKREAFGQPCRDATKRLTLMRETDGFCWHVFGMPEVCVGGWDEKCDLLMTFPILPLPGDRNAYHPSRTVSRRHAVIACENNWIELRDESRYGTFVNGRCVRGCSDGGETSSVRLSTGDEIGFGDVTCFLRVIEEKRRQGESVASMPVAAELERCDLVPEKFVLVWDYYDLARLDDAFCGLSIWRRVDGCFLHDMANDSLTVMRAGDKITGQSGAALRICPYVPAMYR